MNQVTDTPLSFDQAIFGDNPWDFARVLGGDLPARPQNFLSLDVSDNDDRAFHQQAVSIDDFDGLEQELFVLMRDKIRQACNVNTPWKRRASALRWVFVSGQDHGEAVSFNDACEALGVRKMILQTRLQYQLFHVGQPLQEPLPFLSDRLPETLCSEALCHAGSYGLFMSKNIWSWPGIRADILQKTILQADGFGDEDLFFQGLKRLEDNGLIALREAYWFFISRNPMLYNFQGRRRFQWSASFIGNH